MSIPITVTSDFICPWCLIGERRLAKGLEGLPETADIQVRWQPFELNPDMPHEGMDRRTYRSQKFGSWERSQMLDARTVAAARDDDIVFAYDRIGRTPNTFAAHRLAWLAAREDRQDAVVRALFESYFLHGRDIGDLEVLVEIAREAGLDPVRVRSFLMSDDAAADVRALEAEARLRGIQGVPHFDIDGTIVIGAQPAELLRQTILDVLAVQTAA